MHQEFTKARVFISCGQQKQTQEERISREIEERLKAEGFEPYVAVQQQNLQGIREAIFSKLNDAEYFLFIDFKREQLANKSDFRGSLFSHQELAIASHLRLEVIAFQEAGVLKMDGLLQFLQANCNLFDSRDQLVDEVIVKVKDKWKSNWRRQLVCKRPDPNQHDDVGRVGRCCRKARFWHVDVQNLDYRRPALNCYGYLEKVVNRSDGKPISFESAEFKWRGYTFPNALIGPEKSRKLDAFWVFHDDPLTPRFNPFTDWTGCHPQFKGPGQFVLTYAVASENFPLTRGDFILNLDGTLDGISFEATNGI